MKVEEILEQIGTGPAADAMRAKQAKADVESKAIRKKQKKEMASPEFKKKHAAAWADYAKSNNK